MQKTFIVMKTKLPIIIFLFISISAFAEDYNYKKKDSLQQISSPPKHYFRNCIHINRYSSSERKLENKNLGNYSFSETSLGFFIPFYTKDYYKKDSTVIANLHLLIVGNTTIASPRFSALENTHNLSKTSLGLRMFYNNGKKNIFFFNASPFMVHDNFKSESAALRYASVFIFNRTVNEKFSYRVGFLKTFLFGNRYVLPIIGFRFGPLDGVHFNMVLPRSMSFNFPIGKHLQAGIFVKPYGGLYNVINNDTLYQGEDNIIQFGKYELLNGVRLDYNTSAFNVFLSVGITKRNYISLASTSYSNNAKGIIIPFYSEKINATTFASVGMSYKFGKTKKIYNNYTLYDMYDLNNGNLPGDDNGNIGNNEIPKKTENNDIKKIQYRDVQDLIELEDIY